LTPIPTTAPKETPKPTPPTVGRPQSAVNNEKKQ